MIDALPNRPPAILRVRDLSPDRQAELRRLHRLNPWWNLKILAFALIWIAAAAVALRVTALPVRLACYFIIGATIQGLVILMHEAVHGILFRDRRLNRWVGFLCGLPAFLSVSAYRMGHLPHHRYERSARDPDELENFSRDPRVLAALFGLMFLFGELFGFHRVGLGNAFRGRPAERRDVLVEYAIIAAVFAVAIALLPGRVFLHSWVFPALFARQLTNVRTLAEHVLTGHEHRLAATRTVVSNPFVAFFMCNLNYHIEHHLFPAVPWYRLRRLHALLDDQLRRSAAQVYPSYTRFLWDLSRFVVLAFAPGGEGLPLRLPVAAPRRLDEGLTGPAQT